ncbi:uncharacterized protein LOC121810618 [Salvia splendens]|uniref:uncharacterized protein LOC121810618 n=1 Tax=Salvia splendens TaxID=180675 RepID=UPI001C27BB24|nr:uncharacterized protein LOC121810618 [Salvia splendens]
MDTNQKDFSKTFERTKKKTTGSSVSLHSGSNLAAAEKRSKMREDRLQQSAARTTEISTINQQDVLRTTTSAEIRSKKKNDMQKPETSKRGRSQCIDKPEMPARKKQAKAKSDKAITCKIRRPKLVIKIGVKVLVDAIEKMNSKQKLLWKRWVSDSLCI